MRIQNTPPPKKTPQKQQQPKMNKITQALLNVKTSFDSNLNMNKNG